MTTHTLQASFTGGEISPSLQARADAAGFHTWLKYANNMFVHPQGGISNRSGTQFVATAKYANKECRLVSFPISSREAYVLEFGEHYVRFFTASGAVLNAQQNPLELVTPYGADQVNALCVAQYNHTLYLAHAQHPLMCLTRKDVGEFVFTPATLQYGPFMPTNTDQTKQLRLYPQTTTVESEGVSATLTFAPVNYPNLMVWAYFNGSCFYASETYGLNVEGIVNNFNTAYQSQGLSAYNQGGVIKITSSAADGGDWNGKTFVLEYRSRFTGPADQTVTQTLSGGENAGTQTIAQPGRYILQSNTDLFTPAHVGGKFCLVHTVDASYQSGTLGYETTSAAIVSSSDWNLQTSGTWTGSVVVEISRDGGSTWQIHKVLSRTGEADNFYLTGHLNEPENMLYIRVRSRGISGEAGYELSAQSFLQRGVVNVVGYCSGTQVVVEQERACASEEWTSTWAEGSFSPAAGYPACVFVYQDRLGLAATQAEAQTVWFSKTSHFTDFGRARDVLLSTDSLSVRLGGTTLNRIQAVTVANRLLLFTTGGEWTISSNGALSLDSLEIAQQSQRGSYATFPVMIGNRALFVQACGSVVRDLVYDYSTSSYTGDDLTLRAKHLFENRTIAQLAYAQEPDSLLWCLTSDGILLTLTYLPEQRICAWTQHHTQGRCMSICTLAHQGQDEVWLSVQRAGGVCIERFSARVTDDDPAGCVFLDAAVSVWRETADTQVTGLAHLEGQTVGVLADGNVVSGLTVHNASITLPYAAKYVHVGLSYQAEMETLPLSSMIVQDRRYRSVSARVYVLKSRGGAIGTTPNNVVPWPQRTNEGYNTPIALQTTSYAMLVRSPHDRTSTIFITQTEPLPLTVLALSVKSV